MTYRCTRTCFNHRVYTEGLEYDSIGTTDPKFFVEVGASMPEPSAPVADDRAEVKAQLDKRGVKYNSRLGLDKLKALLREDELAAFEA